MAEQSAALSFTVRALHIY